MATSNTGGSYPQIYNPDPSGGENRCGLFVIGNSKDPANEDLKSLKITNSEWVPRRSEKSNSITTIQQGAPQALVAVSDCSGYMGLELGAPVEVNDVVCIDAAHPLGGCYQITAVNGAVACTDTKYMTCVLPLAGGETWTACAGELDPATQGDFLDITDVCKIPQQPAGQNKNKINSFQTYVYTECWECFCGTVDPCDVDIVQIDLWDDESCKDTNVYFYDSSKVVEGNPNDGASSRPGENNAQNI